MKHIALTFAAALLATATAFAETVAPESFRERVVEDEVI